MRVFKMSRRALICGVALIVSNVTIASEPVDASFTLSDGVDEAAQNVISKIYESAKRSGDSDSKDSKTNLRLQAIENQAIQWGNDEGMYFYHDKYQKRLAELAASLDKIADFNQFIIDGNLLLPTVVKTTQLFEKKSSKEIRKTVAAYTLEDKAEVVLTSPTWRQYLTYPIDEPEPMPQILMPKDDEEVKVFEKAFYKGWVMGKEQANIILDEGFQRLTNKLNGLYEYRFANLQNMWGLPTSEIIHDGFVVDNGGDTIYVNDMRFRINHDAYINDIKHWRPVFIPQEALNDAN